MQIRLSFAVFLSLAVVALAKLPGRLNQCCPKTGPEGLALIKQRTGPFAILCSYEQEKICYYSSGSGAVGGAYGCPSKAVVNVHLASEC